jgi:hypothetical protein
VPRERVPVDRELVERGFAAPVLERAEDFAAAPVDLARAGFAAVALPPLFAALLRVPVERLTVDRVAPDLARVPVEPVLRVPPVLRPPELRDELELDDEPEEESSVPHLPVITRWAASATASAMMLPSLVALDIMLVAACEALSAASRPASRILRRALGLALIAAAAAASPAASISLLIAALASLSTVLVVLLSSPDEEPEEVLFEDFAIVHSSLCGGKTHERP